MESVFPTYGRFEVEIESAHGTKVVDKNGKEYLDFIAGIAVCNLGHRHPKVQKAVEEQLNKVWHVSNLFPISLQQDVAKKLTEKAGLDLAFFCNSGAEANEAAIKLVRKYTGKRKIITFKQSFHGRTFATMSATGQEKIHKGFGPLLESFVYLPYNDAKAIEEAMDEDTAAIMLEVVQGEGGVNPGETAFLKKCEELCRKYNALLVIDEIQTGMGRTGKSFAFQHIGLSPDIVTVAKGLGSGFPVGAMLGKAQLSEAFGPGSHGSTFGGNPLAMAAAKATLDVCLDQNFLKEVEEKSKELMKLLKENLSEVDFVSEVRGLGLMIGIECKSEVAPIVQSLRDAGLLVVLAGPNVIRLLPPLTVSMDEMNVAVGLIKEHVKNIKVVAQ